MYGKTGAANPMYGKFTGAANPRYNTNTKKTRCPNPTCPHNDGDGFATSKPSLLLRHHLYGEALKGGKCRSVAHSSACGDWLKDQVAAGNDAVLKAALGLQWRKYIP